MRIFITLFAVLFTTNVIAQTNYDRKQDVKIANTDAKVTTAQVDIALIKKDIAQLKLDNAKLKNKLDSLKITIVAFEKSQFNVSAPIKGPIADTIKVQLK